MNGQLLFVIFFVKSCFSPANIRSKFFFLLSIFYRSDGHQSGGSGGHHSSGGSGGHHSSLSGGGSGARAASVKGGSGGSDRRSIAGSVGSAGSEGGIIKQLGLYVRVKSDSGKKLSDQEILQQIKVKAFESSVPDPLCNGSGSFGDSVSLNFVYKPVRIQMDASD